MIESARFIRCPDCAKIHTSDGITATSVCTCGRSLYPLVYGPVIRIKT